MSWFGGWAGATAPNASKLTTADGSTVGENNQSATVGSIDLNNGVGGPYVSINSPSGGGIFLNNLNSGQGINVQNGKLTINGNGQLSAYGNIGTLAAGLGAIRGIDDRTNIGAADGAAITVYAVPATTGKFRVTFGIVGRSGTITSGIYTLKYIVNGATITDTVSITAVSTDANGGRMILPDASTNITAQITTLTGTNPKVDVTMIVEAVGTNT